MLNNGVSVSWLAIGLGCLTSHLVVGQTGVIDLHLNDPQLDRKPGRAQQNIVYYGEYFVGTPSKRFLACYDTGSGDVWLPSVTCTTSICLSHDQYDPQDSSTAQVPPVSAQQTYSIKYGTGDVRVTKLSDTISFGGIAIPQQAFGAASSLSPDFDTLSCDGLVGLAFPSMSHIATYPAVMTAAQNGALENNMFGLFFNPIPRVEPAGSLSIGSIEPTKFTGIMKTLPVLQRKYWTVSLGGMMLGQTAFTMSVSEAILDSGTTAIYLPQADAQAINQAIPTSSYWEKQDIWNVSCDYTKLPTLTFILGGSPFALPPSLYVQMLASTSGRPLGICSSAIIGGQNRVILGSNFLRGWYTQYSFSTQQDGPASVGLAPAVGLEASSLSTSGRRLQSRHGGFDINKLHTRHWDSFDQPRWGWVAPSRREHNGPPQDPSMAASL